MQLITHKLIPSNSFPNLPTSIADKYAYQLGISFCPSMDLLATYPTLRRSVSSSTILGDGKDSDSGNENATHENPETEAYVENEDDEGVNVEVWRFNGQRVFSVLIEKVEEGKAEVRDVDWRDDGQIIAILSSDRIIRLVNSFSGKVVHRFSSLPTLAIPPSPASPRTRRKSTRDMGTVPRSKACGLSYSLHFSNPGTTQSLLHTTSIRESVILDDLLSLNADINSLLKAPADLPRELANIDVESFLPRLSCLPPVGFGGEDVFSTRTSIDAIFHANRKNVQSGIVNVLVACHSSGIISVRIFDSFEIGGIDINSATGMRKISQLGHVWRMASWPFTSEVFVIAEDTKNRNQHLLSLDMRFITHSSNTLPILATKATQLQNLLRYLTQIQTQLAREIRTAFDLPTRYLRNVNEDLEKQDGVGSSFTTAAYHVIVTGEVSGALKEWLNEQVGERGVKRWEKSVGDCLELVRRLISESWCPAVERAGVVISRLNGLTSCPVHNQTDGLGLGLDRKLVESLRDTVDVMAICGEECLRDVIKEAGGFASFIKWLKWEVEASGLEDTSEKLDEMREGSDHGEVTKVLEYIEQGPQSSVVKKYISSDSPSADVVHDDHQDDTGFYTKFKEQRRREGLQNPNTAFDRLLDRMRRQCNTLFEQIAQNLGQGIMTRHITQLDTKIDQTTMDMRIVPLNISGAETGPTRVHIIARKKAKLMSVVHQIVEPGERQAKAETATTRVRSLPIGDKILDIKFVDDHVYMVLAEAPDAVRIYSHPIEAGENDDWELRHQFNEGVMETGMKPARLEVNGRKKRRVVGVVDRDGKGYVVLDLDSGDVEQDEQDETMTG